MFWYLQDLILKDLVLLKIPYFGGVIIQQKIGETIVLSGRLFSSGSLLIVIAFTVIEHTKDHMIS